MALNKAYAELKIKHTSKLMETEAMKNENKNSSPSKSPLHVGTAVYDADKFIDIINNNQSTSAIYADILGAYTICKFLKGVSPDQNITVKVGNVEASTKAPHLSGICLKIAKQWLKKKWQ